MIDYQSNWSVKHTKLLIYESKTVKQSLFYMGDNKNN